MEFFDFLAQFDDYPTNGLRLGEAAARDGYSAELSHFFNGMPGQFETEADIMPFAEHISKPPRGMRLERPEGRAGGDPQGELTVGDITHGSEDAG